MVFTEISKNEPNSIYQILYGCLISIMITNRILGLNKQRINLAYCMVAHDHA